MDNVFDEMDDLWAEIVDKNQTQRQIDLLTRQLPRGGNILDVACGTGRHSIALTAAGFNVVGIDISPHLLRIAKRQGAKDLVLGDMRFLPFKDDAFGAAISMDTSFGYLSTESEDLQSLAEINRILIARGTFTVDVFNREHFATKYSGNAPVSKTWEYSSFYLQQTRTVSKSGDRLHDLWIVRPKKEGSEKAFEHTVRLYTSQQLTSLLKKARFTLQATYGDYEEQPYSQTTPRLILRASKN